MFACFIYDRTYLFTQTPLPTTLLLRFALFLQQTTMMDGENTTATAGGFTDDLSDLSDLTTARVQPLERAVPVPSTDL